MLGAHFLKELDEDPVALSHREVAALTGLSPGAVTTSFYRFRERLRHLVHEELEATVQDPAALEEERRLAYVAITRAREQLVLTHARTRRVWGEIRIQDPSRFLGDLPADSLAAPRARRPIVSTGPRIVDGNWAGRARPPRPAHRVDEHDQRIPEDDVPVYQVDEAELPVGAQVMHSSLGAGRVVAVTGAGKDRRVVVDFGAIGTKTVLARFLDR